MKKTLLITTMILLCTCTLSSCKKLNIVEERKIILGEEVSSQTINVNDEVINIDKDSDFYLTLNQLNTINKTGNVAYKASYDTKYKIENEKQMYINENHYYYRNQTDEQSEDFSFVERRAKKEGSNAVGEFLEYDYIKLSLLDKKTIKRDMFTKCSYKFEKSFGGQQLVDGKMKLYSNSRFPVYPELGTELAKMESSAKFLRHYFITNRFMRENDIEVSDTVLNFNQHVKKEIKLYDNYIVFEESSPFLLLSGIGNLDQIKENYLKCLNKKNIVTQAAYYNINTGQFDCFSLYGEAFDIYSGFVELDVKVYLHNFDEKEAKNKVNDLVRYVKRKSN
jgi:hypothetical protein